MPRFEEQRKMIQWFVFFASPELRALIWNSGSGRVRIAWTSGHRTGSGRTVLHYGDYWKTTADSNGDKTGSINNYVFAAKTLLFVFLLVPVVCLLQTLFYSEPTFYVRLRGVGGCACVRWE